VAAKCGKPLSLMASEKRKQKLFFIDCER